VERHETVFARLWPAQCHTLTTGDLTDESTAAQFAVIPIPGGVLGGQVLAVTKTSPDRRQSQDLANYLSQPLSQLQLFHDGGYVPTLRQLHADRQVVTELKGLGGHLGQATVRPALAHYTGWSRQFRSSVRAYLLHQSDDIPRDITTPLSPFT
jgi:multiple sugar transport system substrate-binding protein